MLYKYVNAETDPLGISRLSNIDRNVNRDIDINIHIDNKEKDITRSITRLKKM